MRCRICTQARRSARDMAKKARGDYLCPRSSLTTAPDCKSHTTCSVATGTAIRARRRQETEITCSTPQGRREAKHYDCRLRSSLSDGEEAAILRKCCLRHLRVSAQQQQLALEPGPRRSLSTPGSTVFVCSSWGGKTLPHSPPRRRLRHCAYRRAERHSQISQTTHAERER
jgi:hypothetical protein